MLFRKLKQEQKRLLGEIAAANAELSTLKASVNDYEDVLMVCMEAKAAEEIGLDYDPFAIPLDEVSRNLIIIQSQLAQMAKNDEIINQTRDYIIDGSKAKGYRFVKTFGENLLIGFNAYCDKRAKAITPVNHDQTMTLIRKNWEKWRKQGQIMGIELNPKYLELRLSEISLSYDKKVQERAEKQRIRAEIARAKEEERVRKEAENERKQLLAERRMYEKCLVKALSDIEKSEYESKIADVDKRIGDVDYRMEHLQAGWLYVTTTKSMPGVCKIGVTRRENPLKRISELSTASVPFPFCCHAIVFSDSVFDLETAVHAHFDSKRTNATNRHKEFFNITPAMAIQTLRDMGCDVHILDKDCEEEGEIIDEM